MSKGTATYWTSGDYSFDGTGNIAGIGMTRYVYDRSGRLMAWSEAQGSGAYHSESILYDPFGNRQATDIRGCGATFQCYTTSVLARQMAGTTNHYTDATYDAAGNVLTDTGRTFTYDSLGMTRSVVADGRTFLYIYTAADERIAAVEYLANGAQLVTWTPRGFGNELLSVWNGNTWKEDEIWRGSSLVGLLTPGGKRHYSVDHLGSPRVVTNDSGNLIGTQKFTPFGSGGAVDSGALQFTGHERDRANLGGGTVNLPDYAHARLLDTEAGRFLSVDPSTKYELRNPQSWNRYSYAHNNPMIKVDPDGRDAMVVTFPNYRIATPFGRIGGLGHAGIVSIDSKGRTRYYEYGRYDSEGRGIVRRVSVPDVAMGANGVPTRASLQNLLKVISQKSGQNGVVEGAYFRDADAGKVNAFAEGRKAQNDDPSRAGYTLLGNNCSTFCQGALKAGGADDVPAMVDPRPNSYNEELQGEDDFSVRYERERMTTTCDERNCPP